MIYSETNVGHQVASADMNRSMVVNISPPTRQMPPLFKCPAASSCSSRSSHLHNLLTRYFTLFNRFIFQNELKITRTKWKFRHLKLKWIQIPLKLEFEFFLSCDKLLVDKFVWNLFSPYLATRAIPLMAFAYQIFTSDGQIFTRLQCSAAPAKIPFSAPKNDDVPPFSLVIRIRKKIISIHFNV